MAGLVSSPALSLALRAVGNTLIVMGVNLYLPQYVTIFGGAAAYVIIGSLLTLGNLFLRPLLGIVTFPFHLFFTLATTIVVNGLFLWIIYRIALLMDPSIVSLVMTGGLMGWIVVSCVLGAGNWIMKHIL